MTEAEWQAATDPTPMILSLGDRVSERKLRLFAVACARTVWDRLAFDRMREAVDIGERFADGLATEQERFRVMSDLFALPSNAVRDRDHRFKNLTREENAAYLAALNAVVPIDGTPQRFVSRPTWQFAAEVTGDRQPGLLRDIFNPFHPVTFDPAWITPTVRSLAEGIYADGAFDRLPILADALQDAGCENADVLDHCRGDGPHVRGCWVVDLILGKG
jgi:hypothetical protein